MLLKRLSKSEAYARQREQQKVRYWNLRKAKVCVQCGSPVENKARCKACCRKTCSAQKFASIVDGNGSEKFSETVKE